MSKIFVQFAIVFVFVSARVVKINDFDKKEYLDTNQETVKHE